MKADRFIDDPQIFAIPILEVNKAIMNLDSLLARPQFQEVVQAYAALKGQKKWYKLFNGPKDIKHLAIHLKRNFWYDFLYKNWSSTIHAHNFAPFITRVGEGQGAINALRPKDEIQDITGFATSMMVEATRLILKRFRPSERAGANAAVTAQMVQIYERSGGTYGSPRLRAALRQAGVVCNRKRVMRLMRQAGIQARPRPQRVRTTVTDARLPVAPNHLNREFHASAPNQKWLSDITYIATREGWLYLAVVLDLYARTVVGWAMDTHMHSSLVERAFLMATQQRLPAPNLLFHSDRGSQYAALSFQRTLTAAQMRVSMSRKANCWDNAPMESFFGTLKTECAHHVFDSRRHARTAIFTYIETWYNRHRLHSTNRYLAPLTKERAFWHDHNNDLLNAEMSTATTY